MPVKSRFVLQLLTYFLGHFGVDRFYLGQTVLGLLKLLTGGGFGIWQAIDFWTQLVEGFKKSPTTWVANDITFTPESIETGYKAAKYLLLGGLIFAVILILAIGIPISITAITAVADSEKAIENIASY